MQTLAGRSDTAEREIQLRNIPHDARITWTMTNPKTPGKACYDRYQSYKHATNPAESFEMGGTRADLKYDINRGFAFVEDAELRRQLGLGDERGQGGGSIGLTQCATATPGSDASDDQGEETDEEHRAEDAAAATRNAHRQATATACAPPRPLPPKKRRKVEDWQAHSGQRQQHKHSVASDSQKLC
jgi:hypothetical protein